MEKAPNRRIGAFLHFDISWRGGHDFGSCRRGYSGSDWACLALLPRSMRCWA